MTLKDIQPGKIVKITHILGGRGIHFHLSRLGIYKGDKVKVLESAPFGGPILVEHLQSGARIAIGLGMASKIIVEEIDAQQTKTV
ncbi:ferrous iron transport protein A [bacterium]|nr:ferrous iron transport protein A [bacterium]